MEQNERLHLRAGNTDFVGALLPTKITPGVELVKNAERSLSGKLHVDITASKRTLQIIFDILDNDSFERVLDIFNIEDVNKIDSEGILVEYYDLRDQSDAERRFFVENVTFTPFIRPNEVLWQDITVSLVEI